MFRPHLKKRVYLTTGANQCGIREKDLAIANLHIPFASASVTFERRRGTDAVMREVVRFLLECGGRVFAAPRVTVFKCFLMFQTARWCFGA